MYDKILKQSSKIVDGLVCLCLHRAEPSLVNFGGELEPLINTVTDSEQMEMYVDVDVRAGGCP